MRIVVWCDAGPLALPAMAAHARTTLSRLGREYPGRLSLGKVTTEPMPRRVSNLSDLHRLAGEVESALKKGAVELLLVAPPGSALAALVG